jgi:hypothetical protein
MVMSTAGPGERGHGDGPKQERRLRRPPQWLLGAGGGLVGEAALGYHHPTLEMILIIGDLSVPTLLTLIFVAVVLFGSETKEERAFRLLRWIADKPEPPGPVAEGSAPPCTLRAPRIGP